MAAKDFDDFNAQFCGIKSTADIETFFRDLATLEDAGLRDRVLEATEQKMRIVLAAELGDTDDYGPLVRTISALKGTAQAAFLIASLDAEAGREGVEEVQRLSLTLCRLHEARGAKASEEIRVYAEEAAKMSDEDYNSAYGHLRTFAKAAERLLPPQPANPFRKPPKP